VTNETYLLIGLAGAGLLVVWLVFSLLKKVIGFAILAALLVGLYMVWTNPELQRYLLQIAANYLPR